MGPADVDVATGTPATSRNVSPPLVEPIGRLATLPLIASVMKLMTDALLAADADSPRMQQNGINPGERLDVIVSLLNMATFETIKTSLTGGTPLRVGIHVQGFSDGSSASYVSRPPAGGSQPPPPRRSQWAQYRCK